MKLETLLETAATDPKALAELRRIIPSDVTVFVLAGEVIDIEATLDAIGYWEQYNYPPTEWGEDSDGHEILTVAIGDAFPERQRLNPLNLRVVTPGLWKRLWESEDGHLRVAAIYWGREQGEIRMGDREIKIEVRALLDDGEPWPLLEDLMRAMPDRELDAVYPTVQAPQRDDVESHRVVVNAGAPLMDQERIALSGFATVVQEYQTGMIDIGRYLKLKESYVVKLVEHRAVLPRVINAGFDLSGVRTLCFVLGVDYDSLPGQGKTGKVRELVMYMVRRNRTSELADAITRENPAAWSRALSI